MAIRLKKVLEKTLRSFITDEEVRQTAEETGFIRRFRKLEAVKLFWAMMLSFGMGLSKGIEDIRRAYHQTPETSRIARSSFYERLTPEMTLFMKNLLEKVMGRMAKPAHKLEKMLSAFKNLVLIDSTLIKLHDKLKNVFRATGRNAGNKPTEAEAKVQVTIGANSPAPLFLHISGSAKYELESVEIGDWVKDCLLLADLGYYKFDHFLNIHKHGGYFISRVTHSFNPFVVGDNLPRGDDECPLEQLGSRFKDIINSGKREVFDMNVQLCQDYATSGKNLAVMRVVCVWNPGKDRYSCYLTNIPPETLGTLEIVRTYAARWEIEMIFKELKSFYKLDKFNTSKPHIVEALIYAAILSFILSRHVLYEFRKGYNIPPSRSPERRFAAIFLSIASSLLHDLFCPYRYKASWTFRENFILREIYDPNRKREHNIDILRY